VNIDDWNTWHEEYEDPTSELVGRMQEARRQVAAAVDALPPGPVTIVSICGGQGRELIGALEQHPRRTDVRGRLIELDTDNASFARSWADAAGLDALEIVNGDASVSDAYAGLPPVDVVVISGLFGHLDDADQARTIDFLHQLCRPGATIVWTSFRRDPDRADRLRRRFVDHGFDELVYEQVAGDEYRFIVASSSKAGESRPFQPGVTLFTFGSSRQARGAGS
jgi:hypothetical protein